MLLLFTVRTARTQTYRTYVSIYHTVQYDMILCTVSLKKLLYMFDVYVVCFLVAMIVVVGKTLLVLLLFYDSLLLRYGTYGMIRLPAISYSPSLSIFSLFFSLNILICRAVFRKILRCYSRPQNVLSASRLYPAHSTTTNRILLPLYLPIHAHCHCSRKKKLEKSDSAACLATS